MKVIFLDLDGVLNVKPKSRDEFGCLFHDSFVNNLAKIIFYTDAKIVISSTWRGSGLEHLQNMWKYRKLPGEVIGITPYLNFKNSYESVPRGCEIEHFLDNCNFTRVNWSKPTFLEYLENSKIKNYIIFDDDSDMLYNQREHFILTNRNFDHTDHIEGLGLTKECADRAIQILNTPIEDLYFKN